MCNPKTATADYTTFSGMEKEIQEKAARPKRQLAPVFKPYNNRQSFAIFDVEAQIPEHHVARVIDEMIELLPDTQLFAHYPGGGRSSFHPKMMLKVILYAYSQKEYSCRRIEKLIRENLPAMWLAAGQTPDYRTINEFRRVRMPEMIDTLFESMVMELHRREFIEFENYFLDGTKFEANANKYTFVFKKSLETRQEKLESKIRETLAEIHGIAEMEGVELGERPEGNPTVSELAEVASKLEERDEALTGEIEAEKDGSVRKVIRKRRSLIRKKLKLVREDFIPRKEKYAVQLGVCGDDRNSYSKTDPDATFMRMKDDHMKNGQLKPGYNVQMATENQFILFYSIHQRPTDTRCLIPHLKAYRETNLPMPKRIVADAGYGSEENYRYLVEGEDDKPVAEFVVPYGTYIREQLRSFKNNRFNAKNWEYIEEDDLFICPNGRKVRFKKYLQKKNKSGYFQDLKIYECEDCSDCPLKKLCTKAKGNRQVHWNPIYEEMKAKARKALEDETLKKVYALRKIEVETVFGNLKGNLAFRRFLLRGLDKVHVEFGILAMAHNFLKVARILRMLSAKNIKNKNRRRKNNSFFSACFILGTYWTAPLFCMI
ncbi:transposase, IS4 family [Bhargavaea ginsengi]|uniref:Transposase, IS4 family n=2 Tax=Bhargavaea ginsengi TaxID=426757 RepID=A0A1H6T790_9BACL|nr:IS1182 family transposase [Bhargavaea ginsengi]SEI75953.1 transposase, IS4 family [Bhargavaea ginsengi]